MRFSHMYASKHSNVCGAEAHSGVCRPPHLLQLHNQSSARRPDPPMDVVIVEPWAVSRC